MNSKEIMNILKDYIENKNTNYAIMIDGKWGSGKTYFIKQALPQLLENVDKNKDNNKKFAYISLYGTTSIEQISREILYSCLGQKHKGKVETADAIFDVATSLFSASIEAVNIDFSKLSSLLTKIDIKNWFICFDDFERSCLPINEVLGFINQLVEHNHCKVIILTNEEEIGRNALNQNIEEKYSIALKGKEIKFSCESDKSEDKTSKITIEQLKDRTKEIFNENVIYKAIKEKVVGFTIKFEPNMDEAFISILELKQFKRNVKDFLLSNKGFILKAFENYNCKNLRTLSIIFDFIKKIYNTMREKQLLSAEYGKDILKDFLKYVVYFNIYYREGESVEALGLKTQIGYVDLYKSIFTRQIKGFKVLEQYCTTLNFNEVAFENTVQSLRQQYEEQKQEEKAKRKGAALNTITSFWLYDDNEINNALDMLKGELEGDMYSARNYFAIFYYLVCLKSEGFTVDIQSYIELMESNFKKNEDLIRDFETERTMYKFTERKLQKQYDEFLNNFFILNQTKTQKNNYSQFDEIIDKPDWANELYNYCDKNFTDFLNRYGFIDLLNIEKLREKLVSAAPVDIYETCRAFKKVYNASNINEFFMRDKDGLQSLKDKLNAEPIDGISRKKAIDSIIYLLDEVINKLK